MRELGTRSFLRHLILWFYVQYKFMYYVHNAYFTSYLGTVSHIIIFYSGSILFHNIVNSYPHSIGRDLYSWTSELENNLRYLGYLVEIHQAPRKIGSPGAFLLHSCLLLYKPSCILAVPHKNFWTHAEKRSCFRISYLSSHLNTLLNL